MLDKKSYWWTVSLGIILMSLTVALVNRLEVPKDSTMQGNTWNLSAQLLVDLRAGKNISLMEFNRLLPLDGGTYSPSTWQHIAEEYDKLTGKTESTDWRDLFFEALNSSRVTFEPPPTTQAVANQPVTANP